MSEMKSIGKTGKRPVRRTGARVHPSWLETPPAAEPAGRLDAPALRRLWDAVDGK